MEQMLTALGVVAIVGLIIGLVVLSFSLSRQRIAREIVGLGGRIVSINWAPFGKGFFWTPNGSMLFRVVYYDAENRLHEGHCRTDWFLGNRWTENRLMDFGGRDGLDQRQKRAWLR